MSFGTVYIAQLRAELEERFAEFGRRLSLQAQRLDELEQRVCSLEAIVADAVESVCGVRR